MTRSSATGTRVLKGAAGAAAVLAFLVVTFVWFEAEIEVRILCGMISPGRTVTDALRMLDTGNLLEYERVGDDAIRVTTPYTLGTTRCEIALADGRVVSGTYRDVLHPERIAAWVATVLLAALAVFQLLLAAGRPLGHMAWGGANARLSTGPRVASGMFALLLAAGAVAVLEKADVVEVFDRPGLVAGSVWALAVIFALSAVANGLSKSRSERRVMLPLALVLAALCVIVGMSRL